MKKSKKENKKIMEDFYVLRGIKIRLEVQNIVLTRLLKQKEPLFSDII